MPNRLIKDSLLSNEKFNQLNWFEQTTYIRLILLADDYGRLDGREMVIKSYCYPIDEKVTRSAISKAISQMVNVGLLQKYEVNDKPYLLFPNWDKYQRLRSKSSKYPAPELGNMTDTCPTHDSHMTDTCLLEVEVEEELEVEKENTKEKAATIVPNQLKKTKSDAETIKTILDAYNPAMKEALQHFVESRQKMRKPLTAYALELAIKKLNKLSSNEDEQIAIINQAVANGWQGFYELKKDTKTSYTHTHELPNYMHEMNQASAESASEEELQDVADLIASLGNTI